jgi:anthranilate phosphoribosyltransferase
MQALGVKIDAAPAVQTRCLAEIGVCFSLASAHHPAAKHAAAVRRSLGFPTIFNLLGPLANPAGAERQVMGTWTHDNARLLAHALARLGTERALVFCSRDGLDELTTTDVNVVNEVNGDSVRPFELDSLATGLARSTVGALQVGSLDDATKLTVDVLAGTPGPCRDVSLLNAAAGLWVGGAAGSIDEGLTLAAASIDSGAARETLDRLLRLSNEPAV